MPFKLRSSFIPRGDQQEAIEALVENIHQGASHQVLLGVTGSGKTYTISKVIEQVQRPVLVISHNKVLAAQLYSEFKNFFPENKVEYYISYYDYYQPESYIPEHNLYIEKEAAINDEIDRFRLSTVSSLLSGRRDVIVVASVSCIYAAGNPNYYKECSISIKKNEFINRSKLLTKLIQAQYKRKESKLIPGTFSVLGNVIEIFPAYLQPPIRIYLQGNFLDDIAILDEKTFKEISFVDEFVIFPASLYVATPEIIDKALEEIEKDLEIQCKYLESIGKKEESLRLKRRTKFDIEMIREVGYCKGIENYSRYFDQRKPGERPFTLLDYFPDDYLIIIDESHVTIPQLRGMYEGDRRRKLNLVEYGWRLPSALDNRPLRFEEYESLISQVIYMSATPDKYELKKSSGIIIEQIVRPTGIPDPEIEVLPSANQMEITFKEINKVIERNERCLLITLTKRMAENLTRYLIENGYKAAYLHSEIPPLERIKIMQNFRKGVFDVLVGVNLLREGIDVPEVSLVIIYDADKEGFLRSETSLTQIAGRASRNLNSKVILFADEITDAIKAMLAEANRRRSKQLEYLKKHKITPESIKKDIYEIIADENDNRKNVAVVRDPIAPYLSEESLIKIIKETESKMLEAAENEEYLLAAKYRDLLISYQEELKKRQNKNKSRK